ncbi:hypothetical protein [Flagellimonas sp. 2504JD4-2]
MTTFFSILLVLLVVNAVLLIFSVNRTGETFKKPVIKISEASAAKASADLHSDTQYKKAV